MTSGEDIAAVIKSYIAYQMWLLEHPVPKLAERIYAPGTERSGQFKAAITALARRGRHFDCDPETEVLMVEPERVEPEHGDVVDVLVHTRRGPCRLLEASGAEVSIQPGYERSAFRYTFRRDGGRWYLVAEQDLGDA